VESKGDSARAFTPAEKRSWSIGGMLLVLAGSLGTLLRPVDGQLPIMILSDLFYGAALVMFAFGPRSVTGHKAPGTIALVGLALSSLISTVLDPFLASTSDSLALSTIWRAVVLAVAVMAAVAVGRSGNVPSPWGWAPAWVLVAVSLAWLLGVITVGPSSSLNLNLAAVLVELKGNVELVGAVFIGLLAILLPRVASFAGPADASLDPAATATSTRP